MSIFDDIMAADAQAVCGGEFSEAVVYTPSNPSASNPKRTINAVIQRNPPAPLRAAPDYIGPRMIVQVANDATLGISSASLDTGGDTITVAYRIGATPIACKLPHPAAMDAAMLTFELR